MTTVEINTSNFQSEVLTVSDRVVIVDFWAEWCGPCKALSPVLDTLASERAEVLKIGKVNADQEYDLANLYGVRALPTLVMFRDGEPIDTRSGAMSKGDLTRWIDSHAA